MTKCWYYLCEAFEIEARTLRTRLVREVRFVRLLQGNDLAVVLQLLSESRATHFYFSPQAKTVAVAYGAVPCPQPTGTTLFWDLNALARS